jgi:hypothetical protein
MDTTCQASKAVDVGQFTHSRHRSVLNDRVQRTPGRFRRRLIPLICAGWVPQDLVTSGSYLALAAGAGPKPIP